MSAPTVRSEALEQARRLLANVERVIHGKSEAVRLAAVALLSEGHVLLEDVPGTGKTTLARALARSVRASFRRIQFTSDLLPGDVLGVTTWSPSREEFRFTPGPIFAHFVLADELNRSSPRTQSALLESMNERRVSVDGVGRDLPRPFFVIATQNPVEFEGTYPLPESQLDRFLVRIRMGYPGPEHERRMLLERSSRDPLEELEPVLEVEELVALLQEVPQVRLDESLLDWLLALVAATREHPRLLLGASPRAALGWMRAARAHAFLDGRDYVVPEDIHALCLPVLAHRVIPSPRAGVEEDGAEEILRELLAEVPGPE